MAHSHAYDALVIGAGVAGCATARDLALAGLSVLLLDKGDIGGAVSGASLACLGTHMIARDELEALSWSCRAWAGMEEATGRTIEYDRCGQLRFIADERDVPVARGWLADERAAGLRPCLLTPAEVREIEPNLTGPIVAATYSPGDAMVNPFLACRALAADAHRHGAEVRTGSGVRCVRVKGERAVGVDLDNGEFICGAHVVLTAGPWAGRLAATAGVPLAVRPRKAQCLATAALPPGTIKHVVGACEAAAGVTAGYTQIQQARSGQVLFNTVLAGGLAEDGAQDGSPRIERSFLRNSVETLLWLFPSLRDAMLLRSWSRFESVTADERFAIGALPVEGLWVASGCSGTGFVRGPLIGRLLTDLITGRIPPFPHAVYAPGRLLPSEAHPS